MAASVDYPTYGFDTLRTNYNPHETAISPATVSGLALLWQFDISAYDRTLEPKVPRNSAVVSGQPILAAAVPTASGTKDLVLAGDGNGYFYALDANSTAPGGTVVWHSFLGRKTLGDPVDRTFGVRSTPVLDHSGSGAVYAISNVQVFGLDLATGTILPKWPLTLEQNKAVTDGFVHDALNLYGGYLYIGTSAVGGDTPPYFGRIARIAVLRPKITSNWYALSGTNVQPAQSGGGIWGWGGVAIDSSNNGDVYVATGNAVGGSMQQTVYAENIVHLTKDTSTVLGAATPMFAPNGDLDYGNTPLVVSSSACHHKIAIAKNKSAELVVDTIKADGSMDMAQLLPIGKTGGAEFDGTMAFDPVNQLVLVTMSNGSAAPYGPGLAAFHINCAAPWLTPAFQATTLPNGQPLMVSGGNISSPTVANGLAYFGATTQSGYSKVFAVLMQAEGDKPAGTVAWVSPLVAGIFDSEVPMVVNGKLFFSTIAAKPMFYAFGLPAGQ